MAIYCNGADTNYIFNITLSASHKENASSTDITVTDNVSGEIIASATPSGTTYYSVFTDYSVPFTTTDGQSGEILCSVRQNPQPFFTAKFLINGEERDACEFGTSSGSNSSYSWSGSYTFDQAWTDRNVEVLNSFYVVNENRGEYIEPIIHIFPGIAPTELKVGAGTYTATETTWECLAPNGTNQNSTVSYIKIDLTNIKTLTIEGSGGTYAGIWLSTEQQLQANEVHFSHPYYIFYAPDADFIMKSTTFPVTIDTSTYSGDHYLFLGAYSNSSGDQIAKVTSIAGELDVTSTRQTTEISKIYSCIGGQSNLIYIEGLVLYENGMQNVGWVTDWSKSGTVTWEESSVTITSTSYSAYDAGVSIRTSNKINFDDYSKLYIVGTFAFNNGTVNNRTIVAVTDTTGKRLGFRFQADTD